MLSLVLLAAACGQPGTNVAGTATSSSASPPPLLSAAVTVVADVPATMALAVDEPRGQVFLPARDDGSRSTTTIIVRTGSALRRYEVAGNLKPEAFALHTDTLFVIEYLPSQQPTHYRVRGLNLANGDVQQVFGRNKQTVEVEMAGTRKAQVRSADGTMLYTLYQPVGEESEYFIHALSLAEHWTYCIDLPAGSPWSGLELAGPQLLARTKHGEIAEIDQSNLTVTLR